MKSLIRSMLQLLLPLAASAACHAASPFDTPGPFFEYSLDGITSHYGPGGDWTTVSGPSSPAGQVYLSGESAIGSAGVGMYATGSFNAHTWSGWSDTITIQAAPGMTATQGTLNFNLSYFWKALVYGTSTNSIYADVSLIGGPINQYAAAGEDVLHHCEFAGVCGQTWSVGQNTSAPVLGVGSDHSADFSFTVTFGQPYQIVVGLNVQTTGQDARVQIFGTDLHWQGITSVTVDSQAIDYQVTSGSGADYAASIPEASTSVMLLAGLLALAGYSARRSRRAQV